MSPSTSNASSRVMELSLQRAQTKACRRRSKSNTSRDRSVVDPRIGSSRIVGSEVSQKRASRRSLAAAHSQNRTSGPERFPVCRLQRRSGTFATWAEITYVRRLIGIDQSWLGGCQQVESSSRVKNLMQAQIVAIAAPQTAEDNRR